MKAIMKKIYKEFTATFLFISCIFIILSCSDNKQEQTYIKSDSLSDLTYQVLCDETIYNMLKPAVEQYSIKTKFNIVFKSSNAFDAMKSLLSGKAQAIIISRNFTQIEDSLIKAYNVQPYTNTAIAKDALVFFVKIEFPLEAISHEQIVSILSDENASFKKYFPKLKNEPVFICNSTLSSEYENLKTLVLKNKPLFKQLVYKENSDSVVNEVIKNNNNIGIGYLSKVLANPDLRALQVSFTDSTGGRIGPTLVHQANIVQGKYPYIVGINLFVLDDKDENSMKFFRYLSKHPDVQNYFKEVGIVPTFARIVLYE